jgi:hypothetical protein
MSPVIDVEELRTSATTHLMEGLRMICIHAAGEMQTEWL